MLYIAGNNDTFDQVAMAYTIGAYGKAIAYNAGEQGATQMTPGKTYLIPDGWLKPVWQGVTETQYGENQPMTIHVSGAELKQPRLIPGSAGIFGLSNTTLLLGGLGLIALVMLLGNKPKRVVKRRRKK